MSAKIENMDRVMNSLPGRVVRKFLEDQAPNWAALIAWNALFAMFPIVLFVAAILGFVLRFFGEANARVYSIIFSAIPAGPHQSDLLRAVNGVKTASGIFFVIGLIGLLWSGSALFGIMEQAFAVIYHTKPRDFIRQKLIAFGMVLLFTVLVGVAVATSSLLPALKHIPYMPSFLYSGAPAAILQVVLGVLAGFLLFLAMYFVIPNRKQEFYKVLPGAVLGGILFEAVALLFPLYLTLNKGINQYGSTFALLFLLMTFFLFFGMIIMAGVELNSVIYPVPIDLPGKDSHAVAAPQSGPNGERHRKPQPSSVPSEASHNGEVRRGIPARAALGMAVVASLVGVVLGRRSASTS